MKKNLYMIMILLLSGSKILFSQCPDDCSNDELSDLAPTAINESLIPGDDGDDPPVINDIDLGSSSHPWRSLYFTEEGAAFIYLYDALFMHNTGGGLGDTGEGLFLGESAGENVNSTDGINNGCVGIGFGALKTLGLTTKGGGHNTAVGWKSLENLNGISGTPAGMNTMIGSHSGEFITNGSENTGVGWNVFALGSGTKLITGIGNTGIGGATTEGDGILGALQDGSYNTVVGNASGIGITSGSQNTIIGYSSGTGTITGSNNIIVGEISGNALEGGNDNLIIGESSGTGLISGEDNIMIGEATGNSITSGINNIFLGSGTNSSSNVSDFLNIGNTIFGSIGTTKKIGIGGNNLTNTFNVGLNDEFQISLNGKIAKYNNKLTEGNGVPAIIDLYEMTGQTTAISANIATSIEGGLYSIHYNVVTTTVPTSPTPHVVVITIEYIDNDNNAIMTIPSKSVNGVNQLGNSTGTKNTVGGSFTINAKAGTTITVKTNISPTTGIAYSVRTSLHKL